jgi:hypothetical protein
MATLEKETLLDVETMNQGLFNLLFSALVQAFPSEFGLENGQLSPQFNFQFPDPTLVPQAGWVDATDPNFQYEQFNLGNQGPILKQGRFTSGSASPDIFKNYGYWINSVATPSVASYPPYIAANKLMLSAANAVQSVQNNAVTAFASWQAANPNSKITTLNAWLVAEPPYAAAEPYATQYTIANQQFSEQAANLARIVAQLDQPLSDAQTAASSATNTTPYQYTPLGQKPITVTEGTTLIGIPGQDPVSDWASWSTGGNQNLNPQTIPIEVGVVPLHSLQAVTVTTWESYSYFFGLISGSEEVQTTFFQEVTTDEAFQLAINFGSLQPYPITRPGWYSFEALSTYANDQYNSAIDFFNPTTGPLYLIPTTVFLGWNLTVTLTITQALYNSWQSQLNLNQGVFIAGAQIGVGQTPVVKQVGDNVQITFGNPDKQLTDLPYVLGYVENVISSTVTPNS